MYHAIICADCDALVLPAVENNCSPTQNESEIGYLFISVPDATNPNIPKIVSPAFATAAVLTSFITPNGAYLTGIGDLPEPEGDQRVGSLRRIIRDKKRFTVNFTVDDANDTNYTFLRNLECFPQVFIWYMTLSGKVYGDPANGITANVSKANAPLDRGDGAYERFELALTWEHWNHPPRQNGWLYEFTP